jgi:hypothetical protein
MRDGDAHCDYVVSGLIWTCIFRKPVQLRSLSALVRSGDHAETRKPKQRVVYKGARATIIECVMATRIAITLFSARCGLLFSGSPFN